MIGGIGSAIPAITTQVNPSGGTAGTQSAGSSFADVFQSAVNDVDTLQNSADQQIASLLQGSGNADIGKTMVSVEKADVAFQLMMQVRNKVVSAYQEMEKMQF
jgi:flagellar hook-basal body complex protein FliE